MTNSTPPFDNLPDWLAWMETLHPSEIELGLDRVRDVAERMGLLSKLRDEPEQKSVRRPRIVTVAGTNGKGSFVATLQCLLMSAGKTVGAYTSPHLMCFNERIKINDIEVRDSRLCKAFARINEAREDILLTYFEFATLAALEIFAAQPLDYYLLEVGLGGRLDAVNIVDADLAVITAIALDHQQWLGDDCNSIAREKAGIMRESSPVIIADPNPPSSLQVLMAAHRARVYRLCHEFAVELHENSIDLRLAAAGKLQLTYNELPLTDLPLSSVAAAAQAAVALGESFSPEQMHTCIKSLHLEGRYQRYVIDDSCEIILDVAHNPAAAQRLGIKLHFEDFEQVFAVVAIMEDKAIDECLYALKPIIDRWYLPSLPHVARAAAPQTLVSGLSRMHVDDVKVNTYTSMPEAMAKAMVDARIIAKDSKRVCVLVYGSFSTVAEAQSYVSRYMQRQNMR